MTKNFSFSIPKTYNHLFVVCSENGANYFRDKNLEDNISSCESEEVTYIKTILPDNLSRVEVSKIVSHFETVADTINYLHLWPFSHMTNAEVIIDGETDSCFYLGNDRLKTHYRESMEKVNWKDNLFIIYTKNDKSKIGFLLFKDQN